jgi:hypothetical protein
MSSNLFRAFFGFFFPRILTKSNKQTNETTSLDKNAARGKFRRTKTPDSFFIGLVRLYLRFGKNRYEEIKNLKTSL